MKTVIAVVIGLAIGAGCRWFEIPVPAPPRLIGALLVLSLTTGYVATDQLLGGPEPRNGQTVDEATVAHQRAPGPTPAKPTSAE